MNGFSYIDIVKSLIEQRRTIIFTILVFLVLGLVVAFISPKQYRVSTRLMPEYSSGGSSLKGSLGSLAGIAGIDVGSIGEDKSVFPPNLYNEPIYSVNFYLALREKLFYSKKAKDSISISQFFDEFQRPTVLERTRKPISALRGLISGGSKGGQPLELDDHTIYLSEMEYKEWERIRDIISVRFDDERGLVDVEVFFQEGVMAAQINAYVLEYLRSYISEINSSRQLRSLEFIEKNLKKAKLKYDSSQVVLAKFEDSNRTITSNQANIVRTNIQFSHDLYSRIYSTLTQQYENAKVEYEENLYGFHIIKLVRVPHKPDGPRKSFIVLLALLLGLFFGLLLVYFKLNISPELKQTWRQIKKG